jgi:deazaflavin-dependent oxidoreductase (nitroreductase family)
MNKQESADFNARNIAEFRSTGGTLSAFGDAPVLLLTTVGWKSGESRTSPIMYLADDHDPDRVYVFASAAGADTDPAWFRNLVADPSHITVEIGRDTLEAGAEVVPEPARTAIYAVQAERYPGFAGYEEKTARVIPVAALDLQRA